MAGGGDSGALFAHALVCLPAFTTRVRVPSCSLFWFCCLFVLMCDALTHRALSGGLGWGPVRIPVLALALSLSTSLNILDWNTRFGRWPFLPSPFPSTWDGLFACFGGCIWLAGIYCLHLLPATMLTYLPLPPRLPSHLLPTDVVILVHLLCCCVCCVGGLLYCWAFLLF